MTAGNGPLTPALTLPPLRGRVRAGVAVVFYNKCCRPSPIFVEKDCLGTVLFVYR
jgi:hypothetical protein